MKNILLFFLATILINCAPQKETKYNETEDKVGIKEIEKTKELPDLLKKALNAHGGIEAWNTNTTLEYRMKSTLGGKKVETQLFNLKNRNVRISGEGYTLGMDGDQVWVSPNMEAFGDMSARFYHNLIFYFFSIPFVLADDGINYEDLGITQVSDNEYRTLKISYNEGVGDADGDYYIAHFNPETYRLELLLYTVTYFSGEKHENYNALIYDDWQVVEGLLVPISFEGFKYKKGVIGESRYKAEFDQVILKQDAPDPSLFIMPKQAEIDSVKLD